MAHIANRSRFRVTVKNKPELTKYFSFSKLAEVEAYMKNLYDMRATSKVSLHAFRPGSASNSSLTTTFEVPARL